MIAFSDQFVKIKINAGIEPGKEIAEQFHIQGVPQMVFINGNESEIDRIIGYMLPEQFIPRVQDILDNTNTVPDLENRLTQSPVDRDILHLLGGKYEEMGNADGATDLYTQLLESYPQDDSEDINHARYYLAMSHFYDGDKSHIEDFIKNYPQSKYVYDAYEKAARYYQSLEDTKNEVRVLEEFTTKFPDDPGALNGYAWRMSELQKNLDDALIKVRHAVELLSADPDYQANIIDTEAEILWRLGRNDEAVAAIEKAITIDPDSQYFKDQKAKFLGQTS